jgi:hypothetical protein
MVMAKLARMSTNVAPTPMLVVPMPSVPTLRVATPVLVTRVGLVMEELVPPMIIVRSPPNTGLALPTPNASPSSLVSNVLASRYVFKISQFSDHARVTLVMVTTAIRIARTPRELTIVWRNPPSTVPVTSTHFAPRSIPVLAALVSQVIKEMASLVLVCTGIGISAQSL